MIARIPPRASRGSAGSPKRWQNAPVLQPLLMLHELRCGRDARLHPLTLRAAAAEASQILAELCAGRMLNWQFQLQF